MFKKANRVTRLDKALILGFMAGYRDNPRPNAENVITIKLNESKVRFCGFHSWIFMIANEN
jgi:negative elongation factor A